MDLFQSWSGVCLVQWIYSRHGVECVWCNGFIPSMEQSVSGTMDLFQAWSRVCLVQWIYSRLGGECVWCNGFIPGMEWSVSGGIYVFHGWIRGQFILMTPMVKFWLRYSNIIETARIYWCSGSVFSIPAGNSPLCYVSPRDPLHVICVPSLSAVMGEGGVGWTLCPAGSLFSTNWQKLQPLGCIYIRANANAKAIFFFDLLPLTHRCSINTHNGNNATDWKRCRFRIRFRSNINVPLLFVSLSEIRGRRKTGGEWFTGRRGKVRCGSVYDGWWQKQALNFIAVQTKLNGKAPNPRDSFRLGMKNGRTWPKFVLFCKQWKMGSRWSP